MNQNELRSSVERAMERVANAFAHLPHPQIYDFCDWLAAGSTSADCHIRIWPNYVERQPVQLQEVPFMVRIQAVDGDRGCMLKYVLLIQKCYYREPAENEVHFYVWHGLIAKGAPIGI